MPRMARVVVPEYPHHVTQRGNRRQTVFFRDEDWSRYLGLIRAASQHVGTRVLAYCLMPNHVHFVLVPRHAEGLRSTMADAHRRYTQRVNLREGWRGHLWQERFHSVVMDEPHLQAAIPYVECNPVRAGLCNSPEDWRWSSASESRADRPNGLVDWNLRARFVEDVDHGKGNANELDEEIRMHTRTGRPLGATPFVDWLEQVTDRTLRPRKPGPRS